VAEKGRKEKGQGTSAKCLPLVVDVRREQRGVELHRGNGGRKGKKRAEAAVKEKEKKGQVGGTKSIPISAPSCKRELGKEKSSTVRKKEMILRLIAGVQATRSSFTKERKNEAKR